MVVVEFVLLVALFLGLPWAVEASFITTMSLSKATLFFDFRHIPYATGVHRIHKPPPLFSIEHVDPPSMTPNKTAILFTCSTACLRSVKVRMFTSRPDESNLFFFKDNRAVYGVRLAVAPLRAFDSHRLRMDVTLFEDGHALLPMMMLIESMQVWERFFFGRPCLIPYVHRPSARHRPPTLTSSSTVAPCSVARTTATTSGSWPSALLGSTVRRSSEENIPLKSRVLLCLLKYAYTFLLLNLEMSLVDTCSDMPALITGRYFCLKFNFQILNNLLSSKLHVLWIQSFNRKIIRPGSTKDFQAECTIQARFKIPKPNSLLRANLYYASI